MRLVVFEENKGISVHLPDFDWSGERLLRTSFERCQ